MTYHKIIHYMFQSQYSLTTYLYIWAMYTYTHINVCVQRTLYMTETFGGRWFKMSHCLKNESYFHPQKYYPSNWSSDFPLSTYFKEPNELHQIQISGTSAKIIFPWSLWEVPAKLHQFSTTSFSHESTPTANQFHLHLVRSFW